MSQDGTSMTVWIGLFRGINIGGNRMPMKKLVRLLEAEGLSDVKTYIASGNVVFRSERSQDDLRPMIEALVTTHFGFHSNLSLITLPRLEKVMTGNPYKDREHTGKAQHIFFFRAPPFSVDVEKLNSLLSETEAFTLTDEALYFYAPDGIGRSRFAEKMGQGLKADMTARNLNTVEALLDMARAIAG